MKSNKFNSASIEAGLGTPKAWIISNLLFVCALNAAAWMEIYWLSVAVVAFVWLSFVGTVIAFLERKSLKQPVPAVVGYSVDVLILVPLLFKGWYLTTFVCLVMSVLHEFLYGRLKFPTRKL
jgi:hypothetical protein